MGAITGQYGFEQAAVMAVQAGADVLAYGNNLIYDPDVALRAIGALLAAVERGELSEERIEESYRRIQGLKARRSSPTA
jgi:beta-N-acetylhexosaminidase